MRPSVWKWAGQVKSLISLLSAHLTSYVSHERTWPRSGPKVHTYQDGPRSERNCTQESAKGLHRSKVLISSLSRHLMRHASPRRTRPRPGPKVRFYQVVLQSEKNSTRESTNRLNWSKSVISSLSVHSMSHASTEWTQPRSSPKVYIYRVELWSENNCTQESTNSLNRSKSLISSLGIHFMSHAYPERNINLQLS